MSKNKSTKRAKADASVTQVQPAATVQTTEKAPAKSIRQTIRQGILSGMSTKDLTVVVQAGFPGSAAARKPAKHIAHYRCLLKKEGALVAGQAVTA